MIRFALPASEMGDLEDRQGRLEIRFTVTI